MTEPTPGQKMLANVRHLRRIGAPRERIQQEIEYWRGEIDQQNADERKLSGFEKVGGFLSTMGGGATFNTTDEAAGLAGQDFKDEQRFLQNQFREEHPYLSFGAEVLGGLAVPGAILKQAPRAASLGRKALTVMGEGAIQGAASGLGAAEGGIKERATGAVQGGTVGSVAAGTLAGLTRGGSRVVKGLRDMRSPEPETERLARLADETGDTDITQARARLAEFEAARLGDEVMPADVLPQGEGALRQQTVAGGKETRKLVDATLRQRSNRLSNLADERFSEYTGTEGASAQRAIKDRVTKAREEAAPKYAKAEEDAAAYDLTSAEPDFTTPVLLQKKSIQRLARRVMADDPAKYGAKVEDILADPRRSHQLFDQMYKDLGEDIRYLKDKVRARTASAAERRVVRRMERDRTQLLEAIKVRSESYPEALQTYAGEIAHKNAYELGSRKTPADMIPDEMASLEPATVPDYKEAKGRLLRPKTSNPDLGEFARFRDVVDVFSDPDKAAQFKATFGEDKYRAMLRDVLQMAHLQRMRGGAGESTSIDKLVEMGVADPGAIAGMLRSIASGDPIRAITEATRWDQVIDRLRRSKSAKANVEQLTTLGADKTRIMLDMLEKLRAEGRMPRRTFDPFKANAQNAAIVGSRVAGGWAGRP